jgi:TPR repeat protein
LILKAANLNHRYGQYLAGYLYQKGVGTQMNDSLAFEWYSKAAAQNYKPAMSEIGNFYWHGINVERDRSEAFRWYWKANIPFQ